MMATTTMNFEDEKEIDEDNILTEEKKRKKMNKHLPPVETVYQCSLVSG